MTPTPAVGIRVRAFFLTRIIPLFCAFAVTTAPGAAAPNPTTVSFITPTSGQTLSGAVSWSVSAANASRVEFSIDGVVRWTEYQAPYVFGGDGQTLDTTTLADGQHVLSVNAYANRGNSVRASASVTVTVANTATSSPPASSSPPSVSGVAQTGSTLTASAGTWSGSPTSYAYQWQQCDSTGASCAPVAGATATTFVPGSSQLGAALRVSVIASNSGGSASATSAATAPVSSASGGGTAPVASAAPAISGTAQVGATLSASTGTWSGSPTSYAYQWQQCDASGAACTSLSGATGSSFVLQSAQAGATLRVVVVAANAYGSGSATSAATGQVVSSSGGTLPSPPAATSAPTVSGTTQVGSTLTGSNGTWSGSPTGYTYQWRQCDSAGANCTAVAGATGTTFALTSSQAGATLRFTVTATNAAGSTTATSSATGVVTTVVTAAATSLGTSLPTRLPQSSGSGGTFYVDGSKGSDSNAGTSAAPWRTINKALSSVPAAGSIINVMPGTYSSQGTSYAIAFSRAASTSDPITLQAQTPGTVFVTNADPTSSTLGGWIHGASGLRIKGITFRVMANRSNINASALLIENSSRIEVDACTFNEMAEAGVKVRGGQSDGQTADDVWVIDNVFRSSTSVFAQVTGLAFTTDQYYGSKGSHWIYAGQYGTDTNWDIRNGTRRLVITNNVFTGSTAGRDVELGPQAQQSYVVNNTFFGNHAISLLGTSTNAVYAAQGVELFANSSTSTYQTGTNVIANNLFDDLDGHAVWGSGPSESGNVVSTNLSYNLRNGFGYQGRTSMDYEPLYGTSVLFSLGVNVADGDPVFVNPGSWNFHLSSSSPALRSANPVYTYPYDADGSPRPSAPAVGAFG